MKAGVNGPTGSIHASRNACTTCLPAGRRGADDEIRTRDLSLTMGMLYQLSYVGKFYNPALGSPRKMLAFFAEEAQWGPPQNARHFVG